MTYPLRDKYHRIRKTILRKTDAFWPTQDLNSITISLLENRRAFQDLDLQSPMPQQAVEGLRRSSQTPAQEILYKTTLPCTVDPKLGLLFHKGRVVWGSSCVVERERSPSFFKHLTDPKKHLPSAILLHHLHGDNYYHFIVYIMSKLWLAGQAHIHQSVPFVINEAITNTKFFKRAVELGVFGGRDLIIQGKSEIIKIDEAYLPRPFVFHPEALNWTAQKFRGTAPLTNGRPVFALRSPNAANGRTFRNQRDVSQLLESKGFILADPAQLDLPQQAELFAQAPIIAGAHGAALTNMIYRAGEQTGILELFNPGMGGAMYFIMARQLGFEYESAITENPQGRAFTASTEVNLAALELQVDKMMNALR